MDGKITQLCSSDLIEKTRSAASAEALLLLAKENGVEITPEEAEVLFEQLHPSGDAIFDEDLLDGVSGGWLVSDVGQEDSSDKLRKRSSRKGHC